MALVAGQASAMDPLRDPKRLLSPKRETVEVVNTARVILADYDLIRKDFPGLAAKSNEEIDQWLLKNTAVISKPQAAQSKVNTSIQTKGEMNAYRPKDYNRAIVVDTPEGLIDIKGAGSLNPNNNHHGRNGGNGLASLGESIREFSYQKLVENVFRHADAPVETVGSYAVIDLGFDIKHVDGVVAPAGSILRQAHRRSEGEYSLLGETRSLEIERVLRRYGISSGGAALQTSPNARINIQGTADGAVLDFGAFLVEDKFTKPARHFYGTKILLDPKSADYVQPDPKIRVPYEDWGFTRSGIGDPTQDNPWIYAHELAISLRDGTATRADAEHHLKTMLNPAIERFEAAGLRPVPFVMESTVKTVSIGKSCATLLNSLVINR